MKCADKYAHDQGYRDADAMLAKLKADLHENPHLAEAIEWSVHEAVIRALRIVDATNGSSVEASS